LSAAARQFSPSAHRSLTLKQRARAFRHHPTASEALLWSRLKGKALGVQFRRQCIVGDFIVDLLASSIKLAVEIDGGYHERQVSLDARRQQRLQRAGYRVLRLPRDLVMRQTAVAVRLVREAVEELTG
jgi:very-short-patch-repair endonuclease